jgi:hypothetical protein
MHQQTKVDSWPETYHADITASLLGLEKDGFGLFALGAWLVDSWKLSKSQVKSANRTRLRNVEILQRNRRRDVASVLWSGLLDLEIDAIGNPLAVIVVGHGIGVVVGQVFVAIMAVATVEAGKAGKGRRGFGTIVVDLQPASRVGRLSAHCAQDLLTTKGAHVRRKGITNRWVLSNILGDTGSLASCVGQLVAVDTS